MNSEIKQQILDKIKEYDTVIISRHFLPDGDAIGSTKGLAAILRLTYPEKEIYVVNEDYSDHLAFLGGEDTINDGKYEGALGIVVDTGTADRMSNKKMGLCKELIKIDHHVDIRPYGDISWVEEFRSSACEMIADLYDTFKAELKIDVNAATYLYTGMVTDSGRFRFEGVCGETMRLAGILLDVGVNTERLFAELYLEDFEYLKFKSYVYQKMKQTENGVVYIYVDKKMQERFHLTVEQASAVVSSLEGVRGGIIWVAFIEKQDNIRVRLRSRFVSVNDLAQKYHGGGHDKAAGATVYSVKEMKALLKDADILIKDYKENNEGWI